MADVTESQRDVPTSVLSCQEAVTNDYSQCFAMVWRYDSLGEG